MNVSPDEGKEDGEIGSFDDYNPAFEYPGDDGDEVSHCSSSALPGPPSPSPSPAVAKSRTTTFRLISLKSKVLSRTKRIAVLDGQREVSIGRDVAASPRVRLKELAVSKYHASIYWDGARKEWAIVDMGSMHGTFVRARDRTAVGSSETSSSNAGTRLSESRKASMPKILRHLDQVTIGGTTFLVHEHLDKRPCEECFIEGHEEISLFATSNKKSNVDLTPGQSDSEKSLKRKLDQGEEAKNPKRAIARLKSSLLQQHSSGSAPRQAPSVDYKDRSALRRQLHPEPRIPSASLPKTNLPSQALDTAQISVPSTDLGWVPPPPPSPPSSSRPLSPKNIGHKLLLMQGWTPGAALGEAPDIALIEPLQLSMNAPRAGLGSARSTPISMGDNWKEEGKRRRWDDVQRS